MPKLRPIMLIILCAVIAAGLLVRAQVGSGLPDLPLDIDRDQVLFPNAVQYGAIFTDQPDYYIFLAAQGEVINVTMSRGQSRLVPFLTLRNQDDSMTPLQKAAHDLAGRTAEIQDFVVPRTGWYYLEASHDPASGTQEAGSYEILLTGASTVIYNMLDYGELGDLAETDRVLLQSRELEKDVARRYFLAAQSDEHLLFESEQGWTVSLFDLADNMLHEASSRLEYTNEARQWLRLEIREAGEAGLLARDVDGTLVATLGGPLSSFLTLTPSATATATATATDTATPTNTPTATATATDTPTIDPNICNGRPIRFSLGDTVVVDFNQTSALRLTLDLYSDVQTTVAQAYDDQRLVLVDGPDCFGGRVWFWQVHMPSANVYGWVPETDESGDPFLCPLETPECRRFGQ